MLNVLGDHLRGRRTFVQKGRRDRLGEPAQPAAVDDRHVFGAAIGQLGAHAGPNVRLGGSRLISVPTWLGDIRCRATSFRWCTAKDPLTQTI